MPEYYVYLLRCSDDSLYTGVTTDPIRRFGEHRDRGSKAAKYTRSHAVQQIAAAFLAESKQAAYRLEYHIKSLSKSEKEDLVRSDASVLTVAQDVYLRIVTERETLYERILGSLLGGAAGDALGYSVEFLPLHSIRANYGHSGIAAFALQSQMAQISDDTQMTLFTAAALYTALEQGMRDEETLAQAILYGCNDWYSTQRRCEGHRPYTDLCSAPWLHSCRAPGMTCLSALQQIRTEAKDPNRPERCYTTEHRINNSKGCGGVMRTAPIGWIAGLVPISAARLGAEAAALTHGHPMGWLSAGFLSELVFRLVQGAKLCTAVAAAADTVRKLYAEGTHTERFLSVVQKAVTLAKSDMPSEKAIKLLGEGWVGEEALAIALYACLKVPNDLYACLCLSANHDGDSDSTAAIAGNILGAALGADTVQEQLAVLPLQALEGSKVYFETAKRMVRAILP